MKKKRKYSYLFSFLAIFIAAVIITITSLTGCANNNEVKKDDNLVVTVYGNEGGDIYIGKYNTSKKQEEAVEKTNSYTFKEGEYAYIFASANAEYQFADEWYKLSNDYLILENQTSNKFAFKVTNNITFYTFFKKANSHKVSYLSSNVTKNILMIEYVEDGQGSKINYKAPDKSGFDFESWSKDLKVVNSDIEVTPNYTHNIWTVFRDYWQFFLLGLVKTLIFSIIAVLMSLLLGAVICFMRISKSPVLSFLGTAYVEVIRGVPSLLLLLIIYAVVPRIELMGGLLTSEVLACILALFINSSAYVAEIYRSGIQAVDKGQMEASRALGIPYWKTMIAVIIPQAIKNVLPSIGNELIMVIKETSLASQIDAGIGELMSVKRQITAVTLINLEPYFIIAIIYFIVTFSLSKGVRAIEKRLESHEK